MNQLIGEVHEPIPAALVIPGWRMMNMSQRSAPSSLKNRLWEAQITEQRTRIRLGTFHQRDAWRTLRWSREKSFCYGQPQHWPIRSYTWPFSPEEAAFRIVLNTLHRSMELLNISGKLNCWLCRQCLAGRIGCREDAEPRWRHGSRSKSQSPTKLPIGSFARCTYQAETAISETEFMMY